MAGFIVDRVEWAYRESREITGTRQPAEQIRTGLRRARVTCEACGHAWSGPSSTRRLPLLASVGGGYHYKCPNCRAEDDDLTIK